MYEEFYDEGLHYFDEQIEEFKDGLRKTVKEEFLKKMERLEKENLELQEVKNNWCKIKEELEDEKRTYEINEDKMKRDIARMKIDELVKLADLGEKCYVIDTASGYVPKCDKCDDNRKIHFPSPITRKDCTEECPTCGKYWIKYVVEEVSTIKIRFKNNPCIESEIYFIRSDTWGDSITYTNKNIYDGTLEDFDIKNYNMYQTAFASKELAQSICNKLNKERGVPDNLEIKG